MNDPWNRDLIIALTLPPLLSRADFVAKYLPQYVRDYEPPRGIILRPDGRPTRSTKGSVRAQVTKRDNRINEAYARYCAMHEACKPRESGLDTPAQT